MTSQVFFIPWTPRSCSLSIPSIPFEQHGVRVGGGWRSPLLKIHGRCDTFEKLVHEYDLTTLFNLAPGASVRICDPSVSDADLVARFRRFGYKVQRSNGVMHRIVNLERLAPIQQKSLPLSISTVLGMGDAMINCGHAKGHGLLGYSGAMNNLAMGFIDHRSRELVHRLLGVPRLTEAACDGCEGQPLCVSNCPADAIVLRDDVPYLAQDRCNGCLHCVAICPPRAWALESETELLFADAYSMILKTILESRPSMEWLHVACAIDIRRTCDCMSTGEQPLMSDVGILVADDIVALEQATVDLIGRQRVHPWVKERYSLESGKHILESISGRDPYWLIKAAERHGLGSRTYELVDLGRLGDHGEMEIRRATA